MKRILFFLFVAALQVRCSTFSEESVTYIDYPPVLNEANYYYKNKNFERAETEVLRYLSNTSDLYWQGHAYLLLGEIRENSGQAAPAEEAYRKAMGHGAGYHRAVTAQALYRLSWIYEREMKYEDLLVTLLDLEKALGAGDNYVKHIENPARLANTYYVLNQWDQALHQRARVTADLLEQYRPQAKSEDNIFQVQLYLGFLGMKPISTTPHKSQDILSLTQKDLLSAAEMSNNTIAQRALIGLENEYERYFNHVKKLDIAKNPVETAARNKKKIEELAQFLDFIEELRASRRPPEVIVNSKLNIVFFRKMKDYEDGARSLVQKLEIGVQKAKKDHNPHEEPDVAPAPKKPKAPHNKKL